MRSRGVGGRFERDWRIGDFCDRDLMPLIKKEKGTYIFYYFLWFLVDTEVRYAVGIDNQIVRRSVYRRSSFLRTFLVSYGRTCPRTRADKLIRHPHKTQFEVIGSYPVSRSEVVYNIEKFVDFAVPTGS